MAGDGREAESFRRSALLRRADALAADPQFARMRRRLERRLADLLTAAGLGEGKDKMPLDEGIKSELPDQKIR